MLIAECSIQELRDWCRSILYWLKQPASFFNNIYKYKFTLSGINWLFVSKYQLKVIAM
ncbi:hypothetical protein CIT292_07634 [Citrobacter youngae ATCC 29220]|uniref:Uncharacterized protein n=1 Tax=Citrobacter youngae ATCC 29220 TaxID=500640 RepID=D4BAY7_9ENTR|nr:hypothetical protein CIT292_07634 [Citrobacter youngae ATCC 29220]